MVVITDRFGETILDQVIIMDKHGETIQDQAIIIEEVALEILSYSLE